MIRGALLLLAFCLVLGCSTHSTRANSPSVSYSVMPIQLGDARFVQWSQSVPF